MSQGRPSNPSKGTQRPGEARPPEAGKAPGNQPAPAPDKPAASPPPASGSPAAVKPGAPQPSSAAQQSGKPPSPGAPPQAAKPGDSKPADSKPADSKPAGPAGTSSAGAAGGRPTGTGSGSAGPGGSGPGSPGSGGTGSGGTGSGGTGSAGSGGRTPPPSAPVAAAPAQRGGWLPGIVGGVVGAALAAFGAPLLQGPPDLSPEAQSRVASIESDSSAIAERLAVLEADLTPLAERVAGLETFTDEIEPTVRVAVEAAVADVPSRDGAAIAALADEVEGLAATTDQLQATASEAVDSLPLIEAQGERLDEIAASLGALEGRLGEAAERSEALAGSLEQQVAALDADVAGRLETLREAASGEVGEAQAALVSEIEALRGALATAEAELTAVQSDVAALQHARSRAAVAALLMRDNDRSIDNGTPFAEPLDQLTPMASDDALLETTLSELRPYAEAGVPTVQALREGLVRLAETGPTPEVAGSEWLGRTVENITGLVQVRSKDDEVDIATGRLGDADAALRQGEIALAIAHVEDVAATPGAVDPDAAEAWLADARARLAAVDAQAQLDAHIRELLTATVN